MSYEGQMLNHEGKCIVVTCDPYLTHDCKIGNHFRADAEDDFGGHYKLIYLDFDLDIEDLQDCCNWDSYQIMEA